MFCSNCGKTLSDKDKFCSTCGTPVERNAQTSQIPETLDYASGSVAPKKGLSLKKLLLAIVLPAFLLILAAVVVIVIFFGKKTVYLCTETVNKSDTNPTATIYTYDFDKDGRVINYAFKLKDTASGERIDGYELSHTYDRKGKLIETEFELYGADFTAEYVYDGDVLTDIVFDDLPEGYDEDDIELELDRNGNILFLALGDGEANVLSWEFSYHDNGVIESLAHSNSVTNTEILKEFDENGTLRSSKMEVIDQMKTAYEYDERGNMTYMEQYAGNGDFIMQMEMEYFYEKEQVSEIILSLQMPDDMGVELTFVAEWDGLECEMQVEDIDFSKGIDEDMREEIEETIDEGDLEIFLEVNEQGKVIFSEITAMGSTISSTAMEYEVYKLPRSYVFDYDDNPIYLHFLGEL